MYPLLLNAVMICSASAHACLPPAVTISDGEKDADSEDVSVASREGDLSCDFDAVMTALHSSVLNIMR